IVEKLLGPTAEYVGMGLRSWAEKRVQNAGRIFEKAAEKLGDKIDEPGSVPPRVLKVVLDEGSYCDDELTAEYFGGVLASSRSGTSRDDRAASYLKLTSELSVYQIRFHYVSYTAWRALFTGSGLRPTFGEDLVKMWLFLPASFLSAAMDFTSDEPASDILMQCTSGLTRLDLIDQAHWGGPEHVNPLNKKRGWCEVSEWGMCICPTQFGIDYWLWAVGLGATSRTLFLDSNLALPKLPSIAVPEGPIKLVKVDN
ncbi:MAG: hypothetical protein NTY86_02865, partial [Deltaproteobacteria bacterium]|nr:hypothetical protein [Deltaproteobacteria bacterium]